MHFQIYFPSAKADGNGLAAFAFPKYFHAYDLVLLGLGIAVEIIFFVIKKNIETESPQIFLYSKKDEPPTDAPKLVVLFSFALDEIFVEHFFSMCYISWFIR